MAFEVKGFDDTKDELKKMILGLTVEGLNEYCDRVKAIGARECGLANDDLTLQAIKVGKEIAIDFKIKNHSKVTCIKKSLLEVLRSMPVTSKPFFEELIKQMEGQESNIEAKVTIQRLQVKSSNLLSVGYDSARQLLEIEFRNGTVHQYSQVPENVFRGLIDASSKGRYHHSRIRNKYQYQRIR
jgi:hypothetical protein